MIKVKVLVLVFGFELGSIYDAIKENDGYVLLNGMYKGFLFDKDIEVM